MDHLGKELSGRAPLAVDQADLAVGGVDQQANSKRQIRFARKVADVQADPAAVARRLGVAGTVSGVRGLMVTRRPVGAAFVPASAVPFTTGAFSANQIPSFAKQQMQS